MHTHHTAIPFEPARRRPATSGRTPATRASSSRAAAIIRRVAIMISLLVVLSACAAADESGVTGGADEPTATAAATEPAATAPASQAPSDGADGSTGDRDTEAALALPATGTFGVEDIEGGCAYVEVDGQRYQLVTLPDAEVAIDPANGVIVTPDGEQIASAGATITVDGTLDPGMMTFCQIGPVLVVDSVTGG